MQRVAFLYTFFTLAPVIKSVNETGCQPHSGQRTKKIIKRKMLLTLSSSNSIVCFTNHM
ncbi:hypothetical protein Hanom_Chr01g00021131 [Helianthus anomalus]